MRAPRSIAAAIILGALILLVAAGVCAAKPETADPAQPGAATEANALLKTDAGETDFLASLDAGKKDEDPKEESVFATAVGFISRLILVLLLAYGAIYALKRFSGVKPGIGPARRCIRVLENAGLAANRSLHLVEVGSRKFLVASTPSQVSLICELRSDDIPEIEGTEMGAGFRDQLSAFLGSRPDSSWAAKSVAQMLQESSTFLQGQVMQVGKLRRKFRDA